ncbi:MAG: type I-E CRISPR-associated protein Cse1/CasA [bacterium]
MNIAFDPWIPVVNLNGHRILGGVSLLEVLSNGSRYADLAVRPHERVSLMRLFLCVAHAALDGPKDYNEWREVPINLPKEVRKYLTDWKDSFELFHKKKPWLQVADLKGVRRNRSDSGKTSPVALLDFELATGHNSTLNDHGGQRASRNLEPERIALNLLTFQNFSSGGGSPIAQWKTVKTSQVGNPDAPCLSQSMAHCLFRGMSLLETIHLNIPTFETVQNTYRIFTTDKKKGDTYTNVELGRPVWEFFPDSPDKQSDEAVNATSTYLGRLVPISRWIRLVHGTDQMYCCNGFKYDTFKNGFAAEPTAAVRVVTSKDKNGRETSERRVFRVDPKKALWRELSSLLVIRSAYGLGGPLAMSNAPSDSEFDFHVCAMTRDKASMDIALESVFHISPVFQNHLSTYQTEIQGDRAEKIIGAEGFSRKLRWAIEDYRQTIDADWKPRIKRTKAKEQSALRDRLAEAAFLSYWTTVEKQLPFLMTHIEAIGTDTAIPTRDAWRRMLFFAAKEAYKIACGQETPRQMRAFAKGWQKLTSTREERESDKNQLKEDNV